MIKKNRFILFLIFALYSCASINGEIDKSRAQKIKAISAWEDVYSLLGKYSSDYTKDERLKKSLINSELSLRLGVSKYIAKMTITKELDLIYLDAIKKKVEQYRTIGDLISYAEILTNCGIYTDIQMVSLNNQFSTKNNLLVEKYKQSNIRDIIFLNLQSRSENIIAEEEFLLFLDVLRGAKLSLDQIYVLIHKSDFYKESIKGDLLRLEDEFTKEFKNKKGFNKLIYESFIESYRATKGLIHEEFILSIESSYAFYQLLDVGVKKDLLLKSRYAKRIELGPSNLLSPYRRYLLSSYDKEIEIIDIKNKCRWGACWPGSLVSEIEMSIFINTDDRISLSSDYMYRKNNIAEIIYNFNQKYLPISTSKKREKKIIDNIIEYYGLIPKASWKPRKFYYDKNAMTQFRNEIRKLGQKTKDRSIKGGVSTEDLRKSYLEDVISIDKDIFGRIPSAFRHEGTFYTPKEFQKTFHPIIKKDKSLISINNRHTKINTEDFFYIKNNESVKVNSHFKHKKVSKHQIDKVIIKNLDSNQAIRSHIFLNREHAVLIIGYELDRYNRLTKLKIQNLVDQKDGDGGIVHMPINDFYEALGYIILKD